MEPSISNVAITPAEAGAFADLFAKLKREDASANEQALSPATVSSFMRKLGLEKEALQKIWRTCVSNPAEVARDEFFVILKLAKTAQRKLPFTLANINASVGLPDFEPIPALQDNSPIISEAEVAQIESFIGTFRDIPGDLIGKERWELLVNKLDPANSEQLWRLFDKPNPSCISKAQLIASLSIASRFLQGRPLPDKLDPKWLAFITNYKPKPGISSRASHASSSSGGRDDAPAPAPPQKSQEVYPGRGLRFTSQRTVDPAIEAVSAVLNRILSNLMLQEESVGKLKLNIQSEKSVASGNEQKLGQNLVALKSLVKAAETEGQQLATINDALKIILGNARKAVQARHDRSSKRKEAAALVRLLEKSQRERRQSTEEERTAKAGHPEMKDFDKQASLDLVKKKEGSANELGDEKAIVPILNPQQVDELVPLRQQDLSSTALKDITELIGPGKKNSKGRTVSIDDASSKFLIAPTEGDGSDDAIQKELFENSSTTDIGKKTRSPEFRSKGEGEENKQSPRGFVSANEPKIAEQKSSQTPSKNLYRNETVEFKRPDSQAKEQTVSPSFGPGAGGNTSAKNEGHLPDRAHVASPFDNDTSLTVPSSTKTIQYDADVVMEDGARFSFHTNKPTEDVAGGNMSKKEAAEEAIDLDDIYNTTTNNEKKAKTEAS